MQAIIPQVDGGAASMDVSAFAFVLANMEPDALAPVLPGELWEDVLGRREAARDMVHELLAEFADGEVADPAAKKTRVFNEADAEEVSA